MERLTMTIGRQKQIALIAHDNKKQEIDRMVRRT